MFNKLIPAIFLLAAVVRAADHVVVVGANASLTFTPDSVAAETGDTVTFQFVSKNHTIQQSTFPDPCTGLPGGFFQSFNQAVAANASDFPTVSILVNTTNPIWVFCPQLVNVSHCQAGMVMGINPNANHTVKQFRLNAINSANLSSSGNGTAPSSGSSNSASTGGSDSPSSGAMQVQLIGVMGLLAAVGSTMLLL